MRLGLGWLRRSLVAGAALCALTSLAANCVVCQQPLGRTYFWFETPVLSERQAVCASCIKLETRCSACKLPVKDRGLKLDDGRMLCPLHASQAILTLDGAREVMEEAKRSMFRLLRGYGTLPNRNIEVNLVNQRDLQQLATNTSPAQEHIVTVGLTRSFRRAKEWGHTIYLLGGQIRPAMLAAAAHEYTHAWMDENVPAQRHLDRDTIEGFCELAAYKVMSSLEDESAKKVILANIYTHGQIQAFVKADDTVRFYRVVNWILSGVGERIEASDLLRGLTVKTEPVPLPSWPPVVPTPVPDTLQLKGVSGQPGRRWALINDQTLRAGETLRVRVGTSNVMVRCLTVSRDTAEIEVQGRRQELRLRGP